MSEPVHFTTAKQWRRWLERHHDKEKEIWVAFAKKDSGKKSVTYAEAVEEALCFGWIDEIRKRVDDDFYTHRFSPRKNARKWSKINLERFDRLEAEGRMTDVGRAVRPRDVEAPRRFESGDAVPGFITRELALHPVAQARFAKLQPSHRRNYIRWITEAKQDETRLRRLAKAIAMLEM
jgi:uncharacterized protein YdeI (YjbR/CyaY-like superfamily)